MLTLCVGPSFEGWACSGIPPPPPLRASGVNPNLFYPPLAAAASHHVSLPVMLTSSSFLVSLIVFSLFWLLLPT